MQTGLYKDSGGGEQNVIEVDNDGKRVLVYYGEGKTVWYGEEDYSTWSYIEPEPELPEEPEVTPIPEQPIEETDTGEKTLDYQTPPISEQEPPIKEAFKPQKKKPGRKPKGKL